MPTAPRSERQCRATSSDRSTARAMSLGVRDAAPVPRAGRCSVSARNGSRHRDEDPSAAAKAASATPALGEGCDGAWVRTARQIAPAARGRTAATRMAVSRAGTKAADVVEAGAGPSVTEIAIVPVPHHGVHRVDGAVPEDTGRAGHRSPPRRSHHGVHGVLRHRLHHGAGHVRRVEAGHVAPHQARQEVAGAARGPTTRARRRPRPRRPATPGRPRRDTWRRRRADHGTAPASPTRSRGRRGRPPTHRVSRYAASSNVACTTRRAAPGAAAAAALRPSRRPSTPAAADNALGTDLRDPARLPPRRAGTAVTIWPPARGGRPSLRPRRRRRARLR